MDHIILTMLLDRIRQQSYPLTITEHDADALVECITQIMKAVHEDDQIMVRSYYDQVTSALCHPSTSYDNA